MNKLLQKYIVGDASSEETRRVMEWIREDEQHLQEYKRQRKLYDIALWHTESSSGGVAPKSKNVLNRTLSLLLRVAAVAALIVTIAHGYNSYNAQQTEESVQTVIAPLGQYVELYLADGTHVWLNSGSRLTFPGRFSKKERHVKLDGEGYFKVHSNAKRPFVVETDRYNIRALGTEFNVLAYQKDTIWEAALLEGSIEIAQKGEGVAPMRLAPGSVAKLSRNKLTKGEIYTTDYFRWREGLICFNNISLRHMIEKLKLYYGVNFIVHNPQILDTHYTGKFRTSDGIGHVMRVLSLNNKFSYEKDEESNTITIN